MSNAKFEVNDILIKSVGYSMVLYEFYQVTRKTDKSIWVRPLRSTHVLGEDGSYDAFRPFVECKFNDFAGPEERKGMNSYIGTLWDGKPAQEDHLD